MTALRAGVLRYVTEDGTIVESDARTPAPGDAAGPVALVDGAIASASVPMVFPPHHMAGDDYVDGGVVEVVPVRAATELGARRIFAVVAVPLAVPRDDREYASATAGWIGLRSMGMIGVAERQISNLSVAPARGDLTHHRRPDRRHRRALRGGAGAPAHQQGLRLAAGGRRPGRRRRRPRRRCGRGHPRRRRGSAATRGVSRRSCGRGPAHRPTVLEPSLWSASTSAGSATWSSGASSSGSPCPRAARRGGAITRSTRRRSRAGCRRTLAFPEPPPARPGQTVGPPSHPRRRNETTR